MNDKVLQALDGVIHPETGAGLHDGGFVASVSCDGDRIGVVLKFRRAKEPFASSLRRQAEAAIASQFPGVEVSVTVDDRGARTVEKEVADISRRLPGVKKIVAVASGKGGVGKSTLAARLATTLAEMGLRVGVLDADIYGPSQPELFGVADYMPPAETADGASGGVPELIVPAESHGVKVMSIGFFIDPGDALVWRGPMAHSALKQLIRQTGWGELDLLIVDLPPGTGDVHLTMVHELEFDGAVIVSTPQQLAVADVRRGIAMFRSTGVDVPVLGIVENMAWFTPEELPQRRYRIFGEGGVLALAESEGIEFLGEIPIVFSNYPDPQPWYVNIAQKIVDKLGGEC